MTRGRRRRTVPAGPEGDAGAASQAQPLQQADQGRSNTGGEAGGPRPFAQRSPDSLRRDELELWDRVLKRWNEHIGRQVKIAATVVTFVIAIAGFLGLRSLDKMVDDSVRSGVEQAAENVQQRIDRDTERLSDQLGDKLAKMTVEVARMDTEAEKARALIARMDDFSRRFAEIDADLRGRIAEVEDYAKRFDRIEADLGQRMAGLKDDLAKIERDVQTSSEALQTVRSDVNRVDAVAGIAAKAALNPVEAVRGSEHEAAPASVGSATPATTTTRPSPDQFAAIAIRQVPTRLGERVSTSSRQPSVLIIYSAEIAANVPENEASSLLATIEKITYTLDERWFTPNVFERTNRENNFQFSVTVWGRTLVKAQAEFRDGTPAICWAGLMDLDQEIRLDRAACGTAEVPPGGSR